MPRTRAPSGALIANRDPLDRQPMEFRQFHRLRRQFAGSQLAQMAFNGRTKIGYVGNVQRLVGNLNDVAVMIGANDERNPFPAIQNPGSMLPWG